MQTWPIIAFAIWALSAWPCAATHSSTAVASTSHEPAAHMADNFEFRDALPAEDDELARVLYNAFLPIWSVPRAPGQSPLFSILPTYLMRTAFVIR